jgi:ADP-heptose:LPS heptosyltransferase
MTSFAYIRTIIRQPAVQSTVLRWCVLRVTVVHQAALGDTVLLVPLFRSLSARFQHAKITVVTRSNLGQMMTMMGWVDAYASADDRDHSAWFAEPDGMKPNALPDWANCDLLLSAVSNGRDAWARNARLAMKPGAAGVWTVQTPVMFFEPRPPNDYVGHVTAWHREQLGVLGLKEPPPPLLRDNPDGAIVIHPGSGGEAKCWPRERFLQLGRDLKRNGIVPTFILGEAEEERWGVKVVQALKDEFPWYLHMGLYELTERMGRARMYLGNDSGVTHLAAAVGIPVIALYGPSDDTQWRPLGPSVKLLRGKQPKVLESLPVDEVLAEMMAELRRDATR